MDLSKLSDEDLMALAENNLNEGVEQEVQKQEQVNAQEKSQLSNLSNE